jgi:glycosyltransferase involved in cell wall biosynthesis
MKMNNKRKKNPRIIMLDTSPTGGIAHYTYNLCESLAKRGSDVRLLTHRDYELDSFPRSFELKKHFYKAEWYVQSIRFVFKEIMQFRPDIIHIQTLISTRKDWLLFILLKVVGLPIIFTAHNIIPHETRKFEKMTYRWMYMLSSSIIVHADQNKKDFLTHFPASLSRLSVIPHGSYSFFLNDKAHTQEQAREKLDIPKDAQVVLFFGAIRPYKGLHELIAAFSSVVRNGDKAFLLIAGKVCIGTEEEYRQAIHERGITDHVLFHQGYIPFDDVADYFLASDLVALPYEHIYDSGVLHIAYALGVPVVATKVGSFVDHVQDGRTGYLVSSGNIETLTQALAKLMGDKTLCRNMGDNAREYDQEHFNWDEIALKTGALYQSVI